MGFGKVGIGKVGFGRVGFGEVGFGEVGFDEVGGHRSDKFCQYDKIVIFDKFVSLNYAEDLLLCKCYLLELLFQTFVWCLIMLCVSVIV